MDPLGVDRMFYGGNPYDLTSPPNYFDSLFEGDGNSEASSTDSFFSGF
ncbi:MAG: hypothetical protein IJ809_01625 [Clostridia bacterium]|nr:hypothetical protein [Clostridia bacterium]